MRQHGQATANARVIAIDLTDQLTDHEVPIGSPDGFTVARVEAPATIKINSTKGSGDPVIPGRWCGRVDRVYVTTEKASSAGAKLYLIVPNNDIRFIPAGSWDQGVPLYDPETNRFETARSGYVDVNVISETDLQADVESETLENVSSLGILLVVEIEDYTGAPTFTPTVAWVGPGLGGTGRAVIWRAATALSANGEYFYNLVSAAVAEFDESTPIPIPRNFDVGIEVAGGTPINHADVKVRVAFIP